VNDSLKNEEQTMKKTTKIIAAIMSAAMMITAVPAVSFADFLDEPVYSSEEDITASYGGGGINISRGNDGTVYFITEDGILHKYQCVRLYTELLPVSGKTLDADMINEKLGSFGTAAYEDGVCRAQIKFWDNAEAYRILRSIGDIAEIRDTYEIWKREEGSSGPFFTTYLFIDGDIEDEAFIAEYPELGLKALTPDKNTLAAGYDHVFMTDLPLAYFYDTGSNPGGYEAVKRLIESGYRFDFGCTSAEIADMIPSGSRLIKTVYRRAPWTDFVPDELLSENTEGMIRLSDDYGLFARNTAGMNAPLIYASSDGRKYRAFYEQDDMIRYLDIICDQPFTFQHEAREAAEKYIADNGISAEIKDADMTGVISIYQSAYKEGFALVFSDDTDMETRIKTAAAITDAAEAEPDSNQLPVMMSYGLAYTSIAAQRTRGDTNADGKVNVADAVAVLQYIANAEKYPLTAQAKFNADIDGEEGITGGDAKAIQMIDAGIV
jgi:hypothetical protein